MANGDEHGPWEDYERPPQEPQHGPWEDYGPAPSPSVTPDPDKLTKGLIYSQTLNVPLAHAYDQSDEIEKQMKERGAGTVSNIASDIKIGAESSIFGLMARHKLPESLQDPDILDKFVSGLSTMISDLPFNVGGAVVGGAAGTAVGPEGTLAGGAMGTFAVPAMIRKVLADGIQKGDVKSFGDYIQRFIEMAVEGEKGAITGGSMEIAGGGTLPALGKGAVATMAKKAQQVAAITLLSKLMERQLPTASDFGVNAALVGALHLILPSGEMTPEKARQGLLDAYAKDGTLPKDAAAKLQAQPPVLPDMEPGLRPAIQADRAIGIKGHVAAEEGQNHDDVAEMMFGEKPVTMDQLEADPSLADKVLKQSAGHGQDVIDRAVQLKKEQGEEVPESRTKSGRGFVTPDDQFLSRERAKSWVKKNEPEVYEKWAEITGDHGAEFHSDDYAEARERVQNRTMAEGDPDVAAWSPELAQFLAGRRTELNDIKAGDKSAKYGNSVLRDLFVGPRNMLRAQAEQLRGKLEKLIPDFLDQEALTFLRDYKGAPDELRAAIEEIRAGKNEKLKAYIPSMERALTPSPALLQADEQMTAYFTNALGLGRQVGTLESSIDPERYSPRLFKKAMDEEEDARREGRPRFTPRTPHAIRREYLRTLEPLKSGEFQARTFNALDELSVYGDRHATAIATSLFKTELKNSELGKAGSRDSVPSDWRELPGTHKTIVTKDARTGETKQFQQGFMVPPVVADAMKPILEQNVLSNNAFFKSVRNFQSYLKSAWFSFSIFHPKALTLMAASNMKWSSAEFVKTLNSDNNSPEFEERERQAALWGLETVKTGRSHVAEGLTGSESILPKWSDKPGIKQIDKAAKAITHATFGVIQRKFKVMDFSLKEAAWLAKHPDATDAEHGTAMRGIAKEVNAVYGGLNWEMMGVSQNWQEIARAFILAPDWTFSNLANLKYATEGGIRGNAGSNAARMFWFRSFVTGATLTAATSLLVSGQLSKNPTMVHWGTDKQGKDIESNMYFSGAPRDAITWINSVKRDGGLKGTVDFIAFKAAPLVSIAPRLMINRGSTGGPITTPKEGTLEKTGRQAFFAGEELAPAPFALKDIIEGIINDSEHDYSYKDFLLEIAGSRLTHEGGKKSRSGRFSITKR